MMDFSIDSSRGVCGDSDDPDAEYIHTFVGTDQLEIRFERIHNGLNERYAVNRPVEMDSRDYVDTVSDFEMVYPDSTVSIHKDFPLKDSPVEETELMFFGVRDPKKRDEYAQVGTLIGGEDVIGIFTLSNRCRTNEDYEKEIRLGIKDFKDDMFEKTVERYPLNGSEVVRQAKEELLSQEFEHF